MESNYILKEEPGLLLVPNGKRLFIYISTKYSGKWTPTGVTRATTTFSKDMLQNYRQLQWHGPPCLFSRSDKCTQYCHSSHNCNTGNAWPISGSPKTANQQHLQLWIHSQQVVVVSVIIIIIIIYRGQQIFIPFSIQTVICFADISLQEKPLQSKPLQFISAETYLSPPNIESQKYFPVYDITRIQDIIYCSDLIFKISEEIKKRGERKLANIFRSSPICQPWFFSRHRWADWEDSFRTLGLSPDLRLRRPPSLLLPLESHVKALFGICYHAFSGCVSSIISTRMKIFCQGIYFELI